MKVFLLNIINHRISNYAIMVFAICFLIGCSETSVAKGGIKKISDTKFEVEPYFKIANFKDETYIYVLKYNVDCTILYKSKIDFLNKSTLLLDSLIIKGVLVRHLEADNNNNIYLSFLKDFVPGPISLNGKEIVSSNKNNSTNIIYTFDGTDLSLKDSINYIGGNKPFLEDRNSLKGISSTDSGCIIQFNRGYANRNTILNGIQCFNEPDILENPNNGILCQLFYKSPNFQTCIPIQNSIFEDQLASTNEKKYLNFSDVYIKFLAEGDKKLFLSLNYRYFLNEISTNSESQKELNFPKKKPGSYQICQVVSIDLRSGEMDNLFKTEYQLVTKIIEKDSMLLHLQSFPHQQLKLERNEDLIFSLTGTSNQIVYNLVDSFHFPIVNTAYTTIIKFDNKTRQLKVINIPIKPNQLINIQQLSDIDLDNSDSIMHKSYFKDFNYFSLINSIYIKNNHAIYSMRGEKKMNQYLYFTNSQ